MDFEALGAVMDLDTCEAMKALVLARQRTGKARDHLLWEIVQGDTSDNENEFTIMPDGSREEVWNKTVFACIRMAETELMNAAFAEDQARTNLKRLSLRCYEFLDGLKQL